MELAELPDVQHMSQTTLDELTKPIAEYYLSITPATSAALQSYLPTRTAVLLSTLSIALSLLTFSLSFTLFRRQWQRLFRHAQKFFRGTSDGLYTSSNQTQQTTKKLILRFCTLHRMSSEHWSLSHERL